MVKKQNEASRVHSHLMKHINRIRKYAESQTKMNILRKYQITLLNKLLKKLLEEGRISKEELKKYNLKKKEAKKILNAHAGS